MLTYRDTHSIRPNVRLVKLDAHEQAMAEADEQREEQAEVKMICGIAVVVLVSMGILGWWLL